MEARLPYLSGLGIDVLYLPPIHPIGTTNRKGDDGAPTAGPGEPGSPWAIGAADGGHTAVHPLLGSIDDVDHLVAAAGASGIDVALDLAFQCSPDHPWVSEHPEWFRHRPDGSIRYAENPPKRYEDIFPLDFETEDWRGLWEALLEVVEFWISHGIGVFRVDNPHTKPLPFWEWLIGSVKQDHPETIFLAEAFTRPKVMYRLAKVGFTQSYTYFTWRQSRWELESYLTELTATEVADFFRPNFWPNTPDILTEQLQSGRPAGLCPPGGPGRHPGRQLRHLRPGLRAARGRPPPSRVRGVPPFREVRHPALGPGAARQPGRPRLPAQPHPSRPPRLAVQRLAPVPRERQRAAHGVLQVASRLGPRQAGLRRRRPTRW